MAFFRKKQAVDSSKAPPSFSCQIENYHHDERLKPPVEQWRTLRMYYLTGIFLAAIGLVQAIFGLVIVEYRNSSSTPNLVRVDGVRVEEAFDQRRDILMASSHKRAILQRDATVSSKMANSESENKPAQ